MEDYEKLVTAKNNLMVSMGDRFPLYMKQMKRWFKMECSKGEFDNQARKLLRPDQLVLHNQVFIQLLSVCTGLADRPPSPTSCRQFLDRTDKHINKKQRTSATSMKRPHGIGFQAAAFDEYVSNNKLPGICKVDIPEPLAYVEQERTIIDENMLFGRLTTTAWEHNLDGAHLEAAQLMSVAAKTFIKNIMITVLNHRNGCKIRDGSFVHSMGSNVYNPWFHQIPEKHKPRFWNDPYYYGLIHRENLAEDTKLSTEKNTNNTLQQTQMASCASEPENDPTAKDRLKLEHNLVSSSIRTNYNPNRVIIRKRITLQEVYNALRINRSTLLSDSVYFNSMENVVTKLHHITWEDIEARSYK